MTQHDFLSDKVLSEAESYYSVVCKLRAYEW
jgi:hypothetical protein